MYNMVYNMQKWCPPKTHLRWNSGRWAPRRYIDDPRSDTAPQDAKVIPLRKCRGIVDVESNENGRKDCDFVSKNWGIYSNNLGFFSISVLSGPRCWTERWTPQTPGDRTARRSSIITLEKHCHLGDFNGLDGSELLLTLDPLIDSYGKIQWYHTSKYEAEQRFPS